MIVQCEKCRTKFKIDDSKIGPRGAKVRCSKCSTLFTVKREGAEALDDSTQVSTIPAMASAAAAPAKISVPPMPSPLEGANAASLFQGVAEDPFSGMAEDPFGSVMPDPFAGAKPPQPGVGQKDVLPRDPFVAGPTAAASADPGALDPFGMPLASSGAPLAGLDDSQQAAAAASFAPVAAPAPAPRAPAPQTAPDPFAADPFGSDPFAEIADLPLLGPSDKTAPVPKPAAARPAAAPAAAAAPARPAPAKPLAGDDLFNLDAIVPQAPPVRAPAEGAPKKDPFADLDLPAAPVGNTSLDAFADALTNDDSFGSTGSLDLDGQFKAPEQGRDQPTAELPRPDEKLELATDKPAASASKKAGPAAVPLAAAPPPVQQSPLRVAVNAVLGVFMVFYLLFGFAVYRNGGRLDLPVGKLLSTAFSGENVVIESAPGLVSTDLRAATYPTVEGKSLLLWMGTVENHGTEPVGPVVVKGLVLADGAEHPTAMQRAPVGIIFTPAELHGFRSQQEIDLTYIERSQSARSKTLAPGESAPFMVATETLPADVAEHRFYVAFDVGSYEAPDPQVPDVAPEPPRDPKKPAKKPK